MTFCSQVFCFFAGPLFALCIIRFIYWCITKKFGHLYEVKLVNQYDQDFIYYVSEWSTRGAFNSALDIFEQEFTFSFDNVKNVKVRKVS